MSGSMEDYTAAVDAERHAEVVALLTRIADALERAYPKPKPGYLTDTGYRYMPDGSCIRPDGSVMPPISRAEGASQPEPQRCYAELHRIQSASVLHGLPLRCYRSEGHEGEHEATDGVNLFAWRIEGSTVICTPLAQPTHAGEPKP